MIDSDVVVAHFTSQLAGGAGIAAQRLHFALCKAGVKQPSAILAKGSALDATMVPAFQNRTFFLEECCCAGQSLASSSSGQGWIREQSALGS